MSNYKHTDQIGIPLYKMEARLKLKNKIIALAQRHGFKSSYSVGESYLSLNFAHKIWFTHEQNKYYHDLAIKDLANPIPEIRQFIINQKTKKPCHK